MLELVTSDRGPDTGSSDAAVTFERLLHQIAAGDQDAFSELYDRTAPRVLGLVRRVLVDHAQSEEVTQEVFLEVWRTASRFQSQRGSALSWILTMSHRRAVDRVRSSQSGTTATNGSASATSNRNTTR